MVGEDRAFTTISISKNIVDRIDNVYAKFGYNTKSGMIQDCLRRAVERMEARIRNGTLTNYQSDKQQTSERKNNSVVRENK